MITVNEVYRNIKELSSEGMRPRPLLTVLTLSERMHTGREVLFPFLAELQDLRLIRFNESGRTSIRLTLLGCAVTRTRQ